MRYYPGPVVDTRTLVGGRCYVVVWSPHNHMGKYVLQIGRTWSWRWTYWAQIPRFWWQIRGWFGLDRSAAYGIAAGALVARLSGEDRSGWGPSARSERVRDLFALKERTEAALLA